MTENELIEKWLKEDLSETEQAAFDVLDNAALYKEILSKATAFKASGFSRVSDYQAFREGLGPQQGLPPSRRLWVRPMLRIASVLVLGLLISYFFQYDRGTQIQTAPGETREVFLPDASAVVVSAGSELEYKASSWDRERMVALEGEAYFRVAKGSRFDVVTSKGTISVLGTEFNVRQRGQTLEVRCYEGLVRVEAAGQAVEVPAGQFVRAVRGTVASGSHTDSTPPWMEGFSRFDRVPLSEVAAEMERQFGVEIRLEGVDGDRLFTGSFHHGNLDRALEAVARPLNLRTDKTDALRITLRPVEE